MTRIEELAEQVNRMSPMDDMAKFCRLAKELAGRLCDEMKGRVTGRPNLSREDYRERHRAVLERDLYACRSCLKNKGLTVDHIVSRSQGGSDDMDNLWTLCSRCHDLKEHDILHPVLDQRTGRWRMIDRRHGL